MLQAIGKQYSLLSRQISTNMSPQILTYVFLDLETTGLPSEECNKTKITELSMVAVYRDHLLETRAGCVPRVQDKLTFCFNPQKIVNPGSTGSTGLDNDLLQYKSTFNKDVCCLIKTFLNLQQKPVCLIAQNGMGFDFPILKNHFERNNEGLSEDIMCADCFHGFYDILQKREDEYDALMRDQAAVSSAASCESPGDAAVTSQAKTKNVKKNLMKIYGNLSANNNIEDEKNEEVINVIECTQVETNVTILNNISTPKITASESHGDTSLNDNLNELDLHAGLKMKLENECTPKRQTKYLSVRKKSIGEIRNRRYPWSIYNKPKKSYKLAAIYERVLNRQAPEAHRAENDCIYALEISAAIGEDFVTWVDDNCCPFAEIKPMTIGVRIGF